VVLILEASFFFPWGEEMRGWDGMEWLGERGGW